MALTLATILLTMPTLALAIERVANATLMAAATSAPKPEFPAFARTQRVQGQVEVDVTVSPDGTVKAAQAISGHPLLRDSARAAALKWKFDPAKLNKEQDVIGTLVFDFKLSS
jgi:protein TonB